MYQDIVRLLQPTIIFLRVCGVCPSSLRKVHIPISYVAYVVLFFMVFLNQILDNVIGVYSVLHDITYFLVILANVLLLLNVVVLLLSPFLMKEELLMFFKVLKSTQSSLFSLNLRQPEIPGPKLQACCIALLAAPTVLEEFIIISSNTDFQVLVSRLLFALVRIGTVCKISILIGLLNNKLGLLNWHLNYLNHYWPPFLPRHPNKDHGFKDLSKESDWRKKIFVHVGLDSGTLTPEKVRLFNKAHLKLHYAYRKLNHIFSFPVLTMYVNTGVSISVKCFLISCRIFNIDVKAAALNIVGETMGIILMSSLVSIIEKNVSII